MANHKYDHLFKLLIIGESGVGKTCLLLRFTDDSFTANHLTTIGIDFKIKIINLENKMIKLQIWDTAGQERFRTITKTYYKGAHGIILTYDVTDETSFKNIKNWIKQIEQNAQNNVCKVLVGNKCDVKERKVKPRQISFHRKKNLQYYDVSAKSNYNFEKPFLWLARKLTGNPGLQFALDNSMFVAPEVPMNQIQQPEFDMNDERIDNNFFQDDVFGGDNAI
jgi:small GTP-binding protein